MNQSVILLGGNLGNRKAILTEALRLIASQCGSITKSSGIYESEAWGFDAKESFLNQAIIIETPLNSSKLLMNLQAIESELGRTKKTAADQKYESRLIDIDILFFNNDIINKKNLHIPHPRLHLRKFTLDCLLDIIPNFQHPEFNISISELSEACPDHSKVWQYA